VLLFVMGVHLNDEFFRLRIKFSSIEAAAKSQILRRSRATFNYGVNHPLRKIREMRFSP
jgi:hypothetical protein